MCDCGGADTPSREGVVPTSATCTAVAGGGLFCGYVCRIPTDLEVETYSYARHSLGWGTVSSDWKTPIHEQR